MKSSVNSIPPGLPADSFQAGSDRQDTDSIEDTALMLDGGIWWVRLAIENHDLIHYLIGNVAFPFTIDSDFP